MTRTLVSLGAAGLVAIGACLYVDSWWASAILGAVLWIIREAAADGVGDL